MKKTLLIILPLLLIVGCSKPINEETLIDKEGLKYHPDTKELYTGKTTQNRLGGTKEFEGSYKNGKKDGVWIYWSPNGKESSEFTWKEGMKWNGTWIERWDNGQVKWEYTYTNGELDDLWTYYDKNDGGKYVGKEGRYYSKYKGEKIGLFSFFDTDEDGNFNENIRKERKVFRFNTWDKNGEMVGIITHWYRNGNKKTQETWKNDTFNGLSTKWYENGQKKSEGNMKDYVRDGLWTYWYENGQKKSEGNYKGEYKNGRRKEDGKWTWWYENGQKEKEGIYMDEGVLNSSSIKCWDEVGNECECGKINYFNYYYFSSCY